jgi:hypothetical protein
MAASSSPRPHSTSSSPRCVAPGTDIEPPLNPVAMTLPNAIFHPTLLKTDHCSRCPMTRRPQEQAAVRGQARQGRSRLAGRLITTISDPAQADAAELAAAYAERREFESSLDELKTHQRGRGVLSNPPGAAALTWVFDARVREPSDALGSLLEKPGCAEAVVPGAGCCRAGAGRDVSDLPLVHPVRLSGDKLQHRRRGRSRARECHTTGLRCGRG